MPTAEATIDPPATETASVEAPETPAAPAPPAEPEAQESAEAPEPKQPGAFARWLSSQKVIKEQSLEVAQLTADKAKLAADLAAANAHLDTLAEQLEQSAAERPAQVAEAATEQIAALGFEAAQLPAATSDPAKSTLEAYKAMKPGPGRQAFFDKHKAEIYAEHDKAHDGDE